MSTILETLKKLEEDKRLLEKDSDLKELVLRDDQKLPATVEFSFKNFILAGLILVAIILVTLTFSKRPPTENKVTHFPQIPLEKKIISTDKAGSETTVGIPLSNITERHEFYKEKVSENSLIIKAPVRQLHQQVLEPKETGINEIRELIQTATSEAEQPELNPYPEELASPSISIPNLKVKGIIFFSSSSPSNHIFVSTSESKNHKLRVGDKIISATLMHIESNRVVFSYKGETVHLRIGE
jgi:hypothetical protein